MPPDEGQEKKVTGIRLQTVNKCIIFTACVLYALLIYAIILVSNEYQKLMLHTRNYISSQQAAALVSRASDYLTEQVRLFVQNMDVKYMQRYFEEVNQHKRREQALEALRRYHEHGAATIALEKAVQLSRQLMDREIYAMKLVSVAQRYEPSHLPLEVSSTLLQNNDSLMSPKAMLHDARRIVFDEEYQAAKDEIYEYVSKAITIILDDVKQQQSESAEELSQAINANRILFSLLLFLNLLMCGVILLLVIKPLRTFLRCVRERSLFADTGVHEFNCLAKAYNDVQSQNTALTVNQIHLTHKAEHDPLTGALNRNVFNQLDSLLHDKDVPLAMLAIDLDYFKAINDTYGHLMGDQVLIRVAAQLKKMFRPDDYLFRIGGDEFIGLVMGMDREQGNVLVDKIGRLNEVLRHPTDGLPPISLSVGVAFSAHGYHSGLIEEADRALYKAKERGRCCCVISQEKDHPSPFATPQEKG